MGLLLFPSLHLSLMAISGSLRRNKLQERAEQLELCRDWRQNARLHPCLALLHNKPNNIINFKKWETDNMIFVILLYSPVIHFWLPLNSLDRYLYVFFY